MRILHISDTHGPIPWAFLPNDFDALVHSGDWMPEGPHRDRASIACYQMEFLRHEGACLAAWLKDRPFVFCGGNHDLLSEAYMQRELRSLGVWAVAPGSTRTTVLDVDFFGLREVPWICGDFEGECFDFDLERATRAVTDVCLGDEVLVAHCPPQGPLAGKSENKWGNGHLTNAIVRANDKSFERPWSPRLILCGHIHECGGMEHRIGNSHIVNSARAIAVVDIS